MSTTQRPATARPSAPALKLWSTHVEVDSTISRQFDKPSGLVVAAYVVAATKLDALDALRRFTVQGHLVAPLEAAPIGGGPEVAQAIARDDRPAMVEGAALAVYGTTVLALDEQGFPVTAGRYNHDRKRYVPASTADRLAEMIEHAERMLSRGHGLSARDEVALREVIDAAMVRQTQLREDERLMAKPSRDEACLADADVDA